MSEYIVLQNEHNPQYRYAITMRKNFKKINYCDTFNSYGQKIGCHDVGCYCFANSACTFAADCLSAVIKSYPEMAAREHDLTGVTEAEEMFCLFPDNRIDIQNFIREWERENEGHATCTAWSYWDGSNWKSISEELGWSEVDGDLAEKIIKELPDYPYIEGIHETIETENFSFFYSRMEDFPWICTVE
jgi:hypothetical protein